MIENSPTLPGLSPVASKDLVVRFDGGELSSDAGVLALREIETRLGVADDLAPKFYPALSSFPALVLS